jgi:Leu/Phe-tRNA-protein transferase
VYYTKKIEEEGMELPTLSIDYLSYEDVISTLTLENRIYPNMYKNYYWSDDFSAKNYIALAKAGFISVTEEYRGEELLIPEIQYKYALLDFKNLHISKKVRRIINNRSVTLELSRDLEVAFEEINRLHKNSWFSLRYLSMLKETQELDGGLEVISVVLKEEGRVVAGEIGYKIGRTYTSLSGFSNREKRYRNYGTVQLVLLAKYLEKNGFDFWNLGHPFMDYKLRLGAKIYEREDFLKRWYLSV